MTITEIDTRVILECNYAYKKSTGITGTAIAKGFGEPAYFPLLPLRWLLDFPTESDDEWPELTVEPE